MRGWIGATVFAANALVSADARADDAVNIGRMIAGERHCNYSLDHQKLEATVAAYGLTEAVEAQAKRYRGLLGSKVDPSYCEMFERSARIYELLESELSGQFGPFRFRTGVETNHIRWEMLMAIDALKVTTSICAEMIVEGKIQQRQCWVEDPVQVTNTTSVVRWRSDHEIYEIDLQTRVLAVSDGAPLVSVRVGRPPWRGTPLAQ